MGFSTTSSFFLGGMAATAAAARRRKGKPGCVMTWHGKGTTRWKRIRPSDARARLGAGPRVRSRREEMAANLAAQLAALGAPSSGGQQSGGGGAPAARLPPKKRHRDLPGAPSAPAVALRVDAAFRPGNEGARRSAPVACAPV
jgi:hypothetical protein